MTYKTDITQDFLKSILDYDPETGVFTWKVRGDVPKWWNTKYSGKIAGHIHGSGYVNLCLGGDQIKLHQAVYMYVYGYWPSNNIDHINGVRSDNRLCNLRIANNSQNQRNKVKLKSNTTGFKGVSFDKNAKKYSAKIGYENKVLHIGLFNSAEDAYKAYCKKAKELFGEFARLA